MKKIISILVCACVILSAMVFTASAADGVTISFADKANRTQFNSEIQVWQQNGITITNNRNGAYSPVGDYSGRFYKDTEVIVEYPGMTAIVIDSTNIDAKYIAWDKSFTDSNATAVVADGITTITFTNPVNSFTFAKMSAQSRANSITVYAGGTVTPPAVDDEEDKDDTVEPVITLVDAPVAGTAYKFAMDQKELGKLFFITGEMGGYNNLYYATTANPLEAVDTYVEETDGGYYFYILVGDTKNYMNMELKPKNDGGNYVNAVYGDTASTVFTYDETLKTFVTNTNDSVYGFGTYGTFDTIGTNDTVEYPDNHYCNFYTVEVPSDYVPPVEDAGFDPTGKTAAEIVDAAYALAPGAAFSKAATLTGVITSVDTEFSSQYNNVTVTIAVDGASADKPIKCFRLKGEGADKIAVGDKITVTGIIKNYQHASGDTEVEFDAGCTLDSYVKGDGTPATPEKEEKKEEVKTEFGVVEQPVAGTAYKFGMVQGNLNITLYITGEMDGFYMATTEDVSKAADVYLEETTGGYYIYAMVNGAKKYMGIEKAMGSDGKEHINAVYSDAPKSVFTYNATVKTFVTKVDDKEYAFGTRNDREFKTVSPSETKYTENFICQFYGMRVVSGDGSTKAPGTGDNVGAIAVMAMAAAAIVIAASKKR